MFSFFVSLLFQLIYTFSDLYTEVLNNLDETATSSATTLTLAKSFINQAHQSRLAAENWKFLEWDTPETFPCVSGQRFYTLHQEFWRPVYFFNRTTKAYLIEVPNRMLADTDARWNDDTGHPNFYRLSSRANVAMQPTSSSALTIVSTSSADNTVDKAITVRGVTANGVTSESLTPNGTTPVTSVNAFTKILNVIKAAAWTGNMTMTSNSSAVTNVFLFPTEYGRQYQLLEFLVQPDSTDTIEYRFLRQPSLMSDTNDIPDIPAPHSHILVYDALLLFSGYLTDISGKSIAAWTDAQRKAEIALAEAFLEGQSLETQVRYVRYIDGDPAGPRVFTQ